MMKSSLPCCLERLYHQLATTMMMMMMMLFKLLSECSW